MKKKLLSQKTILLLFLSILMFFSFGFLADTYVRANESQVTPKTIVEVAYAMEDGASVRMSNDNKTNGLRFAASMSATDYEALKANKDYTSLIYGVVIAPADYLVSETEGVDKGFTEENLFGDSAIYAWDEYVNGEWVYDEEANAGKTRIINIVASQLNTALINGKAVITASITNLQSNNIARDFVARGYIVATLANGDVDYEMADYYNSTVESNIRSMAIVAEKAVADTSDYALDDTQKNGLKKLILKIAKWSTITRLTLLN